jgi:hypothetical protein
MSACTIASGPRNCARMPRAIFSPLISPPAPGPEYQTNVPRSTIDMVSGPCYPSHEMEAYHMRVRNGQLVRYTGASVWDRFRPCAGNNLQPGQLVRVCTLPGAPPPNTMGQAYVSDPETGKFLCMVSTSSLERVNQTK